MLFRSGTLEGKIENIFSETAQEETLKLKPEKDEEISQSNPIQMSLEVKKPVAVTQLTIQGTKENAITDLSLKLSLYEITTIHHVEEDCTPYIINNGCNPDSGKTHSQTHPKEVS